MMKINVPAFFVELGKGFKRNGPDILTGFGIGSMIVGTFFAVSATFKAVDEIEEYKEEHHKDELTVGETVEACGKCYIPTVIATSIGIGCIVAGHVELGRRNAALATACSIAQASLQEYQSKVVETVGEKKESQIREEIVKDKIEKNPPSKDMIIDDPTGVWKQDLCYDVASGRYFHSDLETLRRAVNKLNYTMNNGSETYISLNEWYMEIGLESIYPLGEDAGWSSKQGLIELKTVPKRMDGGYYVTGITFENPPLYGYDEL